MGEVITGFVTRRLREIGGDPRLFMPDALDLLAAYSSGSVGRLDALLRLTLFLASTENAASVDTELVERAATTTSLPFRSEGSQKGVALRRALVPSPRDRLLQFSSGTPHPVFAKVRLIALTIPPIIGLGALLSLASFYHTSPVKPNPRLATPVTSLPATPAPAEVTRDNPAMVPQAIARSAAGPATHSFPRIILEFTGDRFSEYQADGLAAALRAIGFHVTAVVRRKSAPVQSVRYYYPDDKNFAEHVAQALGEDWRNRIALAGPRSGETVDPGLVRVFIPGH